MLFRSLLVHDDAWALLTFVALALAELAIPYVAENSGEESTPWHVEHIVERFSLFTIIVLGSGLYLWTVKRSKVRRGARLSAGATAAFGRSS